MVHLKLIPRSDGRNESELRPLEIVRNFNIHAEGSVLIKQGNTQVIVTASLTNSVPRFLEGTGSGWITAEYSMLPRATHSRTRRDRGINVRGRVIEIQRLIGRSLRAGFDFERIGEHTIYVDCDVIQADGGTRCASITGGFVAVYDALGKLVERGELSRVPVREFLAAVSVGITEGIKLVDLNYVEDSNVDVDCNLVLTENDRIVEIQGTAEGRTFTKQDLDEMVELASRAVKQEIAVQKKVLGLA
ncbi:MAG: ribonuclease PH [Promethearchaeota archaeon]